MVKKKKKTTKKTSKPAPVRKKKKKTTPKAPISAVKLKEFAFLCEDIVKASASAGIDIAVAIKDFARLKTAWDRGRMLRNISALAASAATVEEAGIELELKSGQLTEMLETDAEVADIWRSARLRLSLTAKKALIKNAEDGKAAAINNLIKILQNEITGKGGFDPHRVTTKQLEELTGKTRQTIHTWYTQQGLTRNSDKTFDLAVFIPWYEKFTVEKIKPAAGSQQSKLHDLKAEKIARDMAKEAGELIERPVFIATMVSRATTLSMSLASEKIETIAGRCVNQPAKKIAETLSEYAAEVIANQIKTPAELQLDEGQAKQLEELMESLKC